jgi:hypothetical protein
VRRARAQEAVMEMVRRERRRRKVYTKAMTGLRYELPIALPTILFSRFLALLLLLLGC